MDMAYGAAGKGMAKRTVDKNARGYPGYVLEALKVFAPPERLKVSEWAERYRLLGQAAAAMPGPWSNSVTPYLTGIMDAVNEPAVEQVVFCKPTQVGGTEFILNVLGYIICIDPGPTMVVYPTDVLAESVAKWRIKPMLRANKALMSRWYEAASKKLELAFDAMYCVLNGANSPASLASRPVRYLLLDEVDKYPGASGKEADAISLAKERTKTFDNRKILMTSTPTISTGPIWKALKECDVERHYFVPCPHCGQQQELKFAQLKWSDDAGLSYEDRASTAAYACEECGALITDAHKPAMLRAGEWRAVRGTAKAPRSVGFWLNTLYSPFVKFSQMARQFLASKDDPEALQNFVNSWLGEPWENLQLRVDSDKVLAMKTDAPWGEVPGWAEMLSAGVDVQRKGCYWTIRAWGKGLTSQNIAYGYAHSLDEVTPIMDAPYKKASGESYLVELCAVDSGDQTEDVYAYCLQHEDWAVPVKGVERGLAHNHFRISTIDRANSVAKGHMLVLVDGDKYKTSIAARLNIELGAPGAWMVNAECAPEYAAQLTAEQRVMDKSGAEVWRPRTSHAANHYLDAEVYAFAAADIRQVREIGLDDSRPQPKPAVVPPGTDDWIGGGQNWIDGGTA